VYPAAWPVVAAFVLVNATTPLYVGWQDTIGFSGGTLTVIHALYMAGLIGSLLVSGALSDRVGRKPVLLPALVVGMVAAVLFATATSVAALAAARLLTGAVIGVFVSAGMAAVTDVAGPDRRRLGALLAAMAQTAGAGLGPLLAGLLSEGVFLVECGLLLAAFAVVWRLPLPAPGGAGARAGRRVRVPGVPRANRVHLALGAGVSAVGLAATSFVLALGPALLADLLDSDNRLVAGVMAAVMFLAATGVQLAVRRLRVVTILLLGAASAVLSMAALVLALRTGSPALLIAAAPPAGAAQGLGQLGGLALMTAHVPAGRRAEANAALNIAGYLPAGVATIGSGYLTDAAGLTAGATAYAAALAAGAVLAGAWVAVRRRAATA
jgi:predicted MFS family arabinose efflux permease